MIEQHSSQIVKTSEVIGREVYNPTQEKLGTIEEIVLDKVSGESRYVVLSFGGFLGVGDKLYALPWKAISYSPQYNGFILSIDKERLKSAPGFDKNNWPDFADPSWSKSINDFYSL